MQLMKMLV